MDSGAERAENSVKETKVRLSLAVAAASLILLNPVLANDVNSRKPSQTPVETSPSPSLSLAPKPADQAAATQMNCPATGVAKPGSQPANRSPQPPGGGRGRMTSIQSAGTGTARIGCAAKQQRPPHMMTLQHDGTH